MENCKELIVKLFGKNMELLVCGDKIVLFKNLWGTHYTAPYSAINKVLYREPSYQKTGFIKIRSAGQPMDFVTYKTGRSDTTEQSQALKDEMQLALNEIEKRVKAARGLPDNAHLVTYF
jgi:hypothetical protein